MTALTASGYSIPAMRHLARQDKGRKFYLFSAAVEGAPASAIKAMQAVAYREYRRLKHHFPVHGGFDVSIKTDPRGIYDITVTWTPTDEVLDTTAYRDESR